MWLSIYRFVTTLCAPLIDLYLLKRRLLGKEDTKRFRERLGHASVPRPAGKLLWVHAASIGEAISVLPILEQLKNTYPQATILMTTGTVTSAGLLQERLPKGAIHQYVPIDRVVTVRRFLAHWQPNVALWVESELWPNLVLETHRTGCQMIQVNARISDHSRHSWRRYHGLANKMLSCFSLCLAQSEADKERFESLGSDNVRAMDNLKYDAPALPAAPSASGDILQRVAGRTVWLAASTHHGEEEMLVQVHRQLKMQIPDILTIIVPRHPNRTDEILRHMPTDVKLAVRSRVEAIAADTDMYLADTVGELGVFYRLCGVVFMGGSLVPHGGQNPLEAARLDCAILTGPYTDNFIMMYQDLARVQAVLRVEDASALAAQVMALLQDGTLRQKYASTALAFLESKRGVTARYLEAMEPYIRPALIEN